MILAVALDGGAPAVAAGAPANAASGASAVASAPAPQSLQESVIQDLRWRNIGNANQKGRISAIDALNDNYAHVVVGTASGGVFKSVNAGTTWEPIFENYGSASIGDVAIFEGDPDIIWVGTGEECGRNSAAWGDGVYKSTDGGLTFTNMGLEDTYTIGTVLTHPIDPDVVYVAALGNIWGPSERGFFKSTDGGATWEKLTDGLPDQPRTGAVEAVMHPDDPDTIWVAFWQRERTAYRLDSGGTEGGIFKTTDGGRTFTKLTDGLPEGASGKIGMDVSRSNPDVLMMHYEHGFQPEDELEDGSPNPAYADMSRAGSGIYRSEDGGSTWTYVNRYWSRPFYYNHIAIDPNDDQHVFSYTIRFQQSFDGGRTLDPMPGGGGHCWHAMWLDPHDSKRFWQGNDAGMYLTYDAGENWLTFKNINATQYYAIGVDMRDPYYICGGLQDAGSSCGPSMTRADAIYTNDWYNISGGDGYHVQINPDNWREVYSEPHPGNTGGRIQKLDALTHESESIRPAKDVNIVNYSQFITPGMEAVQEEKGWGPMGAFRWNWSSPIVMSPHNGDVVFFGANHLFKTTNGGESWYLISPDLTKNEDRKTIKESGGLTPDHDPGGGAEFHGTIITIGQSPVNEQVLWVGTDDGNVQVTRDGGGTWTNVQPNLPNMPAPDLWISRVEASHFDEGTAYVAVDGHRSSYFEPWIFKTTDFGATFTRITDGIPNDEPVYVVKEDLKNPNVLFAGTEFAVYYSIDAGDSWTRLNQNLPTVAVHDLVIHPRDPDVVIGTHGLGLWIMDDISALQQLTPEVMGSPAHLFDNEVATQWLDIQPQGTGGSLGFQGENPTRDAVINYWIGEGVSGDVTVRISDVTGQNERTYTVPARPGVNKLEWDMRYDPTPAQRRAWEQRMEQFRRTGRGGRGLNEDGPEGAPAPVGAYRVTLTVSGTDYVGSVTVREDPLLTEGGESEAPLPSLPTMRR
jgi:photosystem II stability/assembly factor-like uncharacterized protein